MSLAVPLYTLGVALLVARRGCVIQPSEILKIAMPLMLAWWFQKRRASCARAGFLLAGLLLVPGGADDHETADLGTSLLVLAAGPVGDLFAGLSWKLIVPPVLLGPVRRERVLIVGSSRGLCARRRAPAGAARLPAAAHLHPYSRAATRWARAFTSSRADRHRLRRDDRQGLMQGTQTHLGSSPSAPPTSSSRRFPKFGLATCC